MAIQGFFPPPPSPPSPYYQLLERSSTRLGCVKKIFFLPLIVGTRLEGCSSLQMFSVPSFRFSLEDFGLFLGELGALPTEELKARPVGNEIFRLPLVLLLFGAKDWSSSILFD